MFEFFKVFGVPALVGFVVGILVASWIAPETPEGFRFIVVLAMILVIILTALLRAIHAKLWSSQKPPATD